MSTHTKLHPRPTHPIHIAPALYSCRGGRLDAAHLVGRIIRDPPIESLNPLTPGRACVSTPTRVGAATAELFPFTGRADRQSVSRLNHSRPTPTSLGRTISPRTPALLQIWSPSEAASKTPPYLSFQLQNNILTFVLLHLHTFEHFYIPPARLGRPSTSPPKPWRRRKLLLSRRS